MSAREEWEWAKQNYWGVRTVFWVGRLLKRCARALAAWLDITPPRR